MDQLDSVCPIFRDKPGERFCQEGSGVLIEFRGHIFLLTAAHVIEQLEKADLLVPYSGTQIRAIEGSYSYVRPTGIGNDFLDYGYFKLDEEFSKGLKERFYIVREHEFGIQSHYAENELFSFTGYPHRKSNVAGRKASTKFFAYGTYHATKPDYTRLGCKQDANIVAKYDRKNSFNPEVGRVELSVLPHGISGGGVFIWPQSSLEIPPRDRQLVGIGHGWRKEGYFVGTRLEIILAAILHNNPQLN